MARIRTIKPEMWMSSDFVALDPVGKLTFIALISNADDAGRLKTDAHHLCEVFVRGARVLSMQKQLDLMQELGMIVQYAVGPNHYVAIANWAAHQKVDHATPSRIPEPPISREPSRALANSPEDSGVTREPSVSSRSSRARGPYRPDHKEGSTTPTPPSTAQPVDNAMLAGGEEQTPWSPEDLAERQGELEGFWMGLTDSASLSTGSRRAAAAIARLPADLDGIESAIESWYQEADSKPRELSAPTIWPVAQQASNDWLKTQGRPLSRNGTDPTRVGSLLPDHEELALKRRTG